MTVFLLCNPIIAEEIAENKENTDQDEILTVEELTDLYFEKGWTYSLLAALDSNHNLSHKLKLLSSKAAKARLELKRLKIEESEFRKAASRNFETADKNLIAQLDDLAPPRQSKIGIPFDTVLSNLEDQLATNNTLHSKLQFTNKSNIDQTLSVKNSIDINLKKLRNIQEEIQRYLLSEDQHLNKVKTQESQNKLRLKNLHTDVSFLEKNYTALTELRHLLNFDYENYPSNLRQDINKLDVDYLKHSLIEFRRISIDKKLKIFELIEEIRLPQNDLYLSVPQGKGYIVWNNRFDEPSHFINSRELVGWEHLSFQQIDISSEYKYSFFRVSEKVSMEGFESDGTWKNSEKTSYLDCLDNLRLGNSQDKFNRWIIDACAAINPDDAVYDLPAVSQSPLLSGKAAASFSRFYAEYLYQLEFLSKGDLPRWLVEYYRSDLDQKLSTNAVSLSSKNKEILELEANQTELEQVRLSSEQKKVSLKVLASLVGQENQLFSNSDGDFLENSKFLSTGQTIVNLDKLGIQISPYIAIEDSDFKENMKKFVSRTTQAVDAIFPSKTKLSLLKRNKTKIEVELVEVNDKIETISAKILLISSELDEAVEIQKNTFLANRDKIASDYSEQISNVEINFSLLSDAQEQIVREHTVFVKNLSMKHKSLILEKNKFLSSLEHEYLIRSVQPKLKLTPDIIGTYEICLNFKNASPFFVYNIEPTGLKMRGQLLKTDSRLAYELIGEISSYFRGPSFANKYNENIPGLAPSSRFKDCEIFQELSFSGDDLRYVESLGGASTNGADYEVLFSGKLSNPDQEWIDQGKALVQMPKSELLSHSLKQIKSSKNGKGLLPAEKELLEILISFKALKVSVQTGSTVFSNADFAQDKESFALVLSKRKAEQEKLATQKAEEERLRIEKLAKQKAEEERLRIEKLAKQKAEEERLVKEEFDRWLAAKSFPKGKKLNKAIQIELNRIGCNAGTPDGIIGASSKRALQNYIKVAELPKLLEGASFAAPVNLFHLERSRLRDCAPSK